MTQNKIILGFTSSLIVSLVLLYIFIPSTFAPPYAFAQGHVYLNKKSQAVIAGRILSPNRNPISHVPITIDEFDQEGKSIKLASGTSDVNGNFNLNLRDNILGTLKQHKIIILITVNGKTYQRVLNIRLDDKTFNELFIQNQFLPSPPFTVIPY